METLTPFTLIYQGGLMVEFWPHNPEVTDSNPRKDGGIFKFLKITSAYCHLAKQFN